MAIGTVRKFTPVAVSTGTVVNATVSSVAGETLAVEIQHQTAAVVSVTDNTGGTWVKCADTEDQAATSQRKVAIWARIGGAATTTITVTMSASGSTRVLSYAIPGALSVRASAAGTMSTALQPPPVTVVAQPGDYVLGGLGYNQATAGTRQDTLQAGYTELDSFDNGAAPRISTAGSLRTTVGATGPAWTMTSGTTGAVTVAFSPTSANTAPTLQADGDYSIDPFAPGLTSCIASDPNEALPAANYEVVQTAGPTVTLTRVGSQATFTAPAGMTSLALTFAWKVKDSSGVYSNTDSQTITVNRPTWFHYRNGPAQPAKVVKFGP